MRYKRKRENRFVDGFTRKKSNLSSKEWIALRRKIVKQNNCINDPAEDVGFVLQLTERIMDPEIRGEIFDEYKENFKDNSSNRKILLNVGDALQHIASPTRLQIQQAFAEVTKKQRKTNEAESKIHEVQLETKSLTPLDIPIVPIINQVQTQIQNPQALQIQNVLHVRSLIAAALEERMKIKEKARDELEKYRDNLNKILKYLENEYGSVTQNRNSTEREFKGVKLSKEESLLREINYLWSKIDRYKFNFSTEKYTLVRSVEIKSGSKINRSSLFGKSVTFSVEDLTTKKSQADFETDFNRYKMEDNRFCAWLNMLKESSYIIKPDFELFMMALEEATKSIQSKDDADRLKSNFNAMRDKYLSENSSRIDISLTSVFNDTVKVPSIKLPENIEKLCVELDRLGIRHKTRSLTSSK